MPYVSIAIGIIVADSSLGYRFKSCFKAQKSRTISIDICLLAKNTTRRRLSLQIQIQQTWTKTERWDGLV